VKCKNCGSAIWDSETGETNFVEYFDISYEDLTRMVLEDARGVVEVKGMCKKCGRIFDLRKLKEVMERGV